MRRIAGTFTWMIALLLALASPLSGQVCSQVRSQRTIIPNTMTVRGDTTVLIYVSQDSFRTRCVQPTKTKTDTLRLPGRVDTVYVTKPDSVKPPVDTVKPPPVDTVKPPPVDTTKPPTPAGVLFASDWSRGLLDTAQIIRNKANTKDSLVITKWTRWGGNGILAVVPAPAGFPAGMKNVLQVTVGSSAFDWVEADGKWTLPAIGESRAFRVYSLNGIPTATVGWANAHQIESKGTDGSVAGNFYAQHFASAGALGIWDFAIDAPPGWPWDHINNPVGRTATVPGPIAKVVTRIEWKWTRVSASGYKLDLRLSDASGKVLYDRSTLNGWNAGPLSTFTGTFTLDDWAVTGLRIGSNGGFTLAGQPKLYFGGFAVCTDWCGAY